MMAHWLKGRTRLAAVLVLLIVLSAKDQAQDLPTATPEPSPSAFFLEPTATFGPDLEALQDTVTARLSASTFAPLTGEAFDMVLIVEVPSGLTLYEWVDFGQQWGDFEIVAIGEVQSESRADGGLVYRQEITAKLWTPGDKETPESFIGYGANENEILRIPVRQEYFSVPTVVDFNDQNLKPMRPPVNLPYLSPILVAVVMGLLGAGGYYGRRWWRNRPQAVPVVEVKPPHQAALDALSDLDAADETALLSGTADALRDYITLRFDTVNAKELTTDELVEALRPSLPDAALNDLGRILSEADLAKFAGKSANVERTSRVVDFARRWINNVERVLGEQQVGG